MEVVGPNAGRLLSAEEFGECGSAYDHCELWDGRILVGEPTKGYGSLAVSTLHLRLAAHVRERGLGWTPMGEPGFVVQRGPDRVLAPDVCFVSRERLPVVPPASFWPVTPDFAVEVRSPTDRWAAVLRKCGVWIAHGALCVWAVDPHARLVVVMRAPEGTTEHGLGDEVDAAPALADFRLRVAEIFEGMGPADSSAPA